MKEEWLFPGAMVPVDVETTAALVAEIKRLINVVGGMALAQPEQEPVACIWEKNDGYKSLEWGGLEEDEIQEIGLKSYTPLYTHLTQRTWVGLTEDEIKECFKITPDQFLSWQIYKKIEAKLRSQNEY